MQPKTHVKDGTPPPTHTHTHPKAALAALQLSVPSLSPFLSSSSALPLPFFAPPSQQRHLSTSGASEVLPWQHGLMPLTTYLHMPGSGRGPTVGDADLVIFGDGRGAW